MPIHHAPAHLAQAPLVVIVPGMNSGSYLFAGAVATLGQRYRLLVLDTPGSPGVNLPLPFSVEAYARFVRAQVEAADCAGAPFFLIGHSLGSFAAQVVARQIPTQILGLVLVSSSPGQPYTAADLANFPRATGHSFWQLMKLLEADPAAGNKLIFGPGWPTQHPTAYAHFIQQRTQHASSPAAVLAQIAAGGSFSSAGWAAKNTVRTLIIQGGADALISSASARELAKLMPASRYLELYRVGHFPMLEYPGFYAAIERFVGGHAEGEALYAPQQSLAKRWFNRYFRGHG